jgi:hypothetical protein
MEAVLQYLDHFSLPEDRLPPPELDHAPGPSGSEVPSSASGANGPPGPTAAGEPRATTTIDSLLVSAREIWGYDEEMTLTDVVVRLSVDVGKLARIARGATKDPPGQRERELAFGNIILSMIRWAHVVGLNPNHCVAHALGTQEKFARENPAR